MEAEATCFTQAVREGRGAMDESTGCPALLMRCREFLISCRRPIHQTVPAVSDRLQPATCLGTPRDLKP